MIRRLFSVCLILTALWSAGCGSPATAPRPTAVTPTNDAVVAIKTSEDEALLKKLCLQCHLFTEPNTLSKSDWEQGVSRMVSMPGFGRAIAPRRIDARAMINWFHDRAPESLLLTDRTVLAEHAPPLRRVTLQSPRSENGPFISQLKLQVLPSGDRRLLTCDMRNGGVCEVTALDSKPQMRVLSDLVPHPCRLEPTDLSGSGGVEFLVANLGTFPAMDHNLGSVEWLHLRSDKWVQQSLSSNLGRVADLKPFDFDGDGDLDIAVAEFGWRTSGHVLLLENKTRKSAKQIEPQFTQRTLDERHGAVQLEIVDLDGNGRPDVIALLAQEHEVLVAYLNQPDGSFLPRELFRAPHPAWGYSGFQWLDFDGDKDLDVLLTNGDMMDGPTLKPYHSITWLENVGELKFEPHTLAELPGVHRAEAADLDGDGDFDIVACTQLPTGTDQQLKRQQCAMPPALVWLEQTAPGQFEFHVWKHGPGIYPTLTTGDFDGDGKSDVAFGIGLWGRPTAEDVHVGAVELWLSSHAR